MYLDMLFGDIKITNRKTLITTAIPYEARAVEVDEVVMKSQLPIFFEEIWIAKVARESGVIISQC